MQIQQIKELNLLSILNRDYFKKASSYYQSQNYNKALKYALKAVNTDSNNIDKNLLLGNIYYVLQNYEKAQSCYEKILSQDSENVYAQINYADTLILQGKYNQAEQYLPEITNNETKIFLLGKLNFEQENYVSAEECFISYTKLKNTDPWGWNMLSQTAQKNNNFTRALDAGFQAILASDEDASQHLNFAYTLYEIAVEKGANFVLPWLKKWQQKYPKNPMLLQSWNSFFPSENFERSLPEYVENVFDNFADSFEEVLSELSYHAPLLITQKIKQVFADSLLSKKRILDLGCGTGLCGENIKKIMPKSLVYGVDLSCKMLEVASHKKVYKKLIKSDIETYLSASQKKFDIIIASDVFSYFGNLQNLLSLCARNIRSGGAIFYTVSTDKFDKKFTWKQHLSGRFMHSKKYVEKCMQKSGFFTPVLVAEILRSEGEKNVEGYIVFAIKK